MVKKDLDQAGHLPPISNVSKHYVNNKNAKDSFTKCIRKIRENAMDISPSTMSTDISVNECINQLSSEIKRSRVVEVAKALTNLPENHFNRRETNMLVQLYVKSSKTYNGEHMTLEEFRGFLIGTLGLSDLFAIEGLCRLSYSTLVMGKRYEKVVSIDKYLKAISVIMRGNEEERATLAFQVFDIDDDGLIQSGVEIKQLLRQCVNAEMSPPLHKEDPLEAYMYFKNFLETSLGINNNSPMNMEKFIKETKNKKWLVELVMPALSDMYANVSFEKVFFNK